MFECSFINTASCVFKYTKSMKRNSKNMNRIIVEIPFILIPTNGAFTPFRITIYEFTLIQTPINFHYSNTIWCIIFEFTFISLFHPVPVNAGYYLSKPIAFIIFPFPFI